MKRLLILFFTLIVAGLQAQKTEGIVSYEQKINMHINLPEEDEMRSFLPEFQISNMELLFTEKESLFREAEKIEDFQREEGGMSIEIKRGSQEVYRNIEEGATLSQQEFFGKEFLVSNDGEQPGWKLTTEMEEIAGYTCTKAVLEEPDKERHIEAWFTPAIPVSTGPGSLGQLPGLILKADVDHGKMVITATNIEFKSLEKGDIKAPKRGKKVTRKEYDTLVAEKMKEMEMEGGGGAVIKIIRQ